MHYKQLNKLSVLLVFLAVASIVLISCKKERECEEVAWYQDSDHDGRGNSDVIEMACLQPAGYVSDMPGMEHPGLQLQETR